MGYQHSIELKTVETHALTFLSNIIQISMVCEDYQILLDNLAREANFLKAKRKPQNRSDISN